MTSQTPAGNDTPTPGGGTRAPAPWGVAYGFGAYLLWGAFPLYFAALAPAGAVWYGHVQRWLLRMLGFRGVSNAHVPLPVRPVKRWFSVRYREPATREPRSRV